MKIKKTKILLLLFIGFLITTQNVKVVFAADNVREDLNNNGNDNDNGAGNGENNRESCSTKPGARIISENTTQIATYYITKKIYGYEEQFYDSNENKMFDITTNTFYENKNIIAGTAIGASMYEYIDYTWKEACYKVKNTEYEYKSGSDCYWVYDCSLPKICLTRADKCQCRKKPVCTPTWDKCAETSYIPTSCTAEQKEEIKNKVKKEVDKIPNRYIVTIPDPNNIACSKNSKASGCENYEAQVVPTYDYPEDNRIIKRFNYEMYGACVNVKTAKVRYLTNSESKCKANEEIKVENYTESFEKRHWHIFVPLNTKTTDEYKIIAKNTQNKMDDWYCNGILEKYPNIFRTIISPATGDYTGINSVDINMIKKNGCIVRATYIIPVLQKFYNEEQEGDKLVFKGYSFYYRPIDIKNPFPNGIAADSYWADWNKQKDKTPDLEKSFNSLTYVATNINANSVRAYNSENPYTSWSNMNINGKSQFIENGIDGTKIITRYANTKSFYNLGCGPANKDWEECK